jgi:flavin reductase (DIM6/NTAB) family NADH-FMN oxidoreductase RutF/uncharacterized protein YciI
MLAEPLARKTSFDVHKESWHPSILPGQIVLISTVDENGEPDVAPKSWITMVAFAGPILAFGCNKSHATYRNVLATRQFVVNVPREGLVERIWAMPGFHGAERIRQAGFATEPSSRVRPPSVAECSAHLECELDTSKEYGEEVLMFGRVVAGRIESACVTGSIEHQYLALRPIFFLENQTYGSIEAPKRVGRPSPVEFDLYVVEILPHASGSNGSVDTHVSFLRSLWESGRLLKAGPFPSPTPTSGESSGGMYVVAASGLAEAQTMARDDPLVQGGAPHRIRRRTRTF